MYTFLFFYGYIIISLCNRVMDLHRFFGADSVARSNCIIFPSVTELALNDKQCGKRSTSKRNNTQRIANGVYVFLGYTVNILGILLLTWINFHRSMDISEVKYTFEMLTVHGQQHTFSTHDRMFFLKYWRFWDRRYLDLMGTWTLNVFLYCK